MSEITAARINNLHERIKLILGTGSGDSGYGQSLLSSPIDNQTSIINALDVNKIYADMIKARVHQVGPSDLGIAEVVKDLNVVAEDTSFFVDDDGTVANDPEGTLKGLSDFESVMSNIETDKFKMNPSQADLEIGITDRITSKWNGRRYQEVSVTFSDEDHRRYFFNTGGEIRFSATNTGAITPKGLDWSELCSEIGIVSFNFNRTLSTGDGSGSSIGNYQITTSPQIVYQKVGSGTYSQIYSGNIYTIRARYLSEQPNVIIFNIEFNDVVTANRIDNDVDGVLESVVQQYRANGDAVSVESPSFYNESTL